MYPRPEPTFCINKQEYDGEPRDDVAPRRSSGHQPGGRLAGCKGGKGNTHESGADVIHPRPASGGTLHACILHKRRDERGIGFADDDTIDGRRDNETH